MTATAIPQRLIKYSPNAPFCTVCQVGTVAVQSQNNSRFRIWLETHTAGNSSKHASSTATDQIQSKCTILHCLPSGNSCRSVAIQSQNNSRFRIWLETHTAGNSSKHANSTATDQIQSKCTILHCLPSGNSCRSVAIQSQNNSRFQIWLETHTAGNSSKHANSTATDQIQSKCTILHCLPSGNSCRSVAEQ
jgi:hypothetical protein